MKYQKTLAALATTSIIAIGLVAYGAGDKAEEKKDKDAKKDDKKDEMATKKASDVPNTVKNPQEGEVIVKCAGIVKKGKKPLWC